MAVSRSHGGPDAQGAARWDFSTNANACGPCPQVLDAIRHADATRYPDPHYQALREKLAHWHGVAAQRVLLAASASEFIMRITAVVARLAPGPVVVPLQAYGDYSAAACAQGLNVVHAAQQPALVWHCDPSSPLGQTARPNRQPANVPQENGPQVLDLAYAPLRLEGASPWQDVELNAVFQLHSPNKALGLTGIRGAYAIAPVAADRWSRALEAAAPSWPLGAHALAMLDAWPNDDTQRWLDRSRDTLRAWKHRQLELFSSMGCEPRPSVANFFCAKWPAELPLAALRDAGIGLRDCNSFGLPGWVRASVQPPAAQQALQQALARLQGQRSDPQVAP